MIAGNGTGTGPSFDVRLALEAAILASAAASEVLLRRFRPTAGVALNSWMKSPGALVTDADLESDAAIRDALEKHRAPGRILSEESVTERDGAGLTWLIDPLCGTVPFASGMSHWGINIALRREGVLTVAVLNVPTAGEQLSAVRGLGVSRTGRPYKGGHTAKPLAESTVGLEIDGGTEWARLLSGGLEWVPSVGQVNTFASAAYPMMQLCLGRLDAVVFYGIEPVHLAAGALVASELGLRVTDISGTDIDWSSDGEIPVVVVGWPSVHAELIAAIHG
jgi:myo-inositol-1(or 4)-monophosphatase